MTRQLLTGRHEPRTAVRTPVGPRDTRAVVVFVVGLLSLFGFFAGGAFVGRWSRLPEAPAFSAQQAEPAEKAPAEYFLVEVQVTDDHEAANALVTRLRRQYTSATVETDQTDRKYHVYVGPYDAPAANTVAAELAVQGLTSVTLKPYRR
jgi:hypothetical protein